MALLLPQPDSRPAVEIGVATIRSVADPSTVLGIVSFRDTPQGLAVTGTLRKLTPGTHGFHIHQFGSCADAGMAAGGHFDPLGTAHGLLTKDGPGKAHFGDMGNIAATDAGAAAVDLVLPRIKLATGKHSVAGRTVVVHEKADDFTQPAGNAGARVACGVVRVASE